MKLVIEGKLVKQGNSIYIRVPKAILEALGKKNGDFLKLEIKGDK